MALTTANQLDTALRNAAASTIQIYKSQAGSNSGPGVEAWASYWMGPGWPVAGAAPAAYTAGSGYTYSKDTTGAIPYRNASTQNYLARVRASGRSGAGTINNDQPLHIVIADRLWACTSIGSATGTYTITTPGSLPARVTDSGVGCELWLEQSATASTSSSAPVTIVANYLNTAAAAKTSGSVIFLGSATWATGIMTPLTLAAGDLGVSQLTSVALSVNAISGTGKIGVTILKRVCEFTIPAWQWVTYDWSQIGLPRLLADACLFMFAYLPPRNSDNNGGQVSLNLGIVDL